MAWLLDQCPPEYRGYAVLSRFPVALARLAAHHMRAGADGARRALASVRADLAGVVPPPGVEAVVEVLEAEQVRLMAVERAVALVEEALRGHRYVPRL